MAGGWGKQEDFGQREQISSYKMNTFCGSNNIQHVDYR